MLQRKRLTHLQDRTPRAVHKLLVWMVLACALLSCVRAYAQAEETSTLDLIRTFPEAERSGEAYVTHTILLDNCRVLTLSSKKQDSREANRVKMLIVTGPNKAAAQQTAKRLATLLSPKHTVQPFEGNEPSVAVFLDTPERSDEDPETVAGMLERMHRSQNYELHLLGWQGCMLRLVLDKNRKSTAQVELLVDVQAAPIPQVIFRLTKGSMKDGEIRAMIKELVYPSISAEAYKPSTRKNGKVSPSDFYSTHILSYDDEHEVAITNKGKIYRAGHFSVLRTSSRNAVSNAKFELPEAPSAWPDAVEASTAPSTPSVTPSTPPATPPSPNKRADSLATKLPAMPAGAPAQPQLNIAPKEALYKYLFTLRHAWEKNAPLKPTKVNLPKPAQTTTPKPAAETTQSADTPKPADQPVAGKIPDRSDRGEKQQMLLGSDVETMFPGAEKDGDCYIFRLDNSRIVALTAPAYPREVQLILVTSSRSKSDAHETARRLAELVGGKVSLFMGNEPSAAILMPDISSLDDALYSTLNLVLYPRPGYESSTSFVGWEGGSLICRVSSQTEGATGTFDVVVNPRALFNTGGVEVRAPGPNADILKFLQAGRMWSVNAGAQPTAEQEAQLRKELPCKRIVSFFSNGPASSFCVLELRDNVYLIGSYLDQGERPGIQTNMKKGYTTAPIPFPQRSHPWPSNK